MSDVSGFRRIPSECAGCASDMADGLPHQMCCGALRCAACDLAHIEPSASELAKQTDFCRSMHFACWADGLGRCPTCGVHLRGEPAPGKGED